MDTNHLIEVLGRLPHESEKAWLALVDYVTMGDGEGARGGRSLRALIARYRVTGGPTRRMTTIERWSSQFEWMARAALWDRQTALEQAQLWVDRREKLREVKWQDGERLRRLGRIALDQYADRLDQVAPGAAVKMMQVASELQNAALGEPEHRDQVDLKLPDDWERVVADVWGSAKAGADGAGDGGESGGAG